MPAAVRLPRTVAARRALLVTLFLGGLLGLGFLFGGSAQAAESDGSSGGAKATLSAPVQQLRQHAKDRTAQRENERDQQAPQRHAVEDTVVETVRPVAERTERLTRPVTDLLDDTTDSTDTADVTDTAGALVGLPESKRDEDGPRPDTGRQGPRQSSPGAHTAPAPTPAQYAAGHADRAFSLAQHDIAEKAEQVRPGGAPQPQDRLPVRLPQAPASSGSASQFTGDGSGPRGGEAQAAPASDAPRFGLTAGAVRTASGSPTRERSTEILEFPG
ncbi:hypothetical protein [Streptomyces sp. 8N706]|uniref:hypothetical protein n=1 Tax=Streptomyces sp. 8N706 TaxID=3457416 RepID=UPI003FD2DFB1